MKLVALITSVGRRLASIRSAIISQATSAMIQSASGDLTGAVARLFLFGVTAVCASTIGQRPQ